MVGACTLLLRLECFPQQALLHEAFCPCLHDNQLIRPEIPVIDTELFWSDTTGSSLPFPTHCPTAAAFAITSGVSLDAFFVLPNRKHEVCDHFAPDFSATAKCVLPLLLLSLDTFTGSFMLQLRYPLLLSEKSEVLPLLLGKLEAVIRVGRDRGASKDSLTIVTSDCLLCDHYTAVWWNHLGKQEKIYQFQSASLSVSATAMRCGHKIRSMFKLKKNLFQ